MAELKSDIVNEIAAKLADGGNNTASEVRALLNKLLDNDYYTPTLPDATNTPGAIGGIPAGTSITKYKGKHITAIINDLLFGAFTATEGAEIPAFDNANDLSQYEGSANLVQYNFSHLGKRYSFLMQEADNALEITPNGLDTVAHVDEAKFWQRIGGTPIVFRVDLGDVGSPNVQNDFFKGHTVDEIDMKTATGDLRFLTEVQVSEDRVEFGQTIKGSIIFKISL